MAKTPQSVIIANLLESLADVAKLKSLDITPWWNLSKNGKHIAVEAYDLGGFAHVSCLYSNTMFSINTGETLILTPYAKDMPLFIVDFSRHFHEETLNLEFYDLQISPIDLSDVGLAAPQYKELPASQLPSGFHDQHRMAPSYGVKGRDCGAKMKEIADYTMKAYAQMLQKAQPCDEAAKRKIVDQHVEALLVSDSPNVAFYRKALPENDVPTFVRKVIYGLRQD